MAAFRQSEAFIAIVITINMPIVLRSQRTPSRQPSTQPEPQHGHAQSVTSPPPQCYSL